MEVMSKPKQENLTRSAADIDPVAVALNSSILMTIYSSFASQSHRIPSSY
jgi:hypothetical protein